MTEVATAQAVNATKEGESTALRLYDAGYGDALVKLNGKRPIEARWLELVPTRNDIAEWTGNLGLRTRHFPTIDVDLDDPRLSGAVDSALASCIVPAPKRTGRAPRFAVVCRLVGEPFAKHVISIATAAGAVVGKVEILGDGQQVAIDGRHPDTGVSYSWTDGRNTGDASILAACSPASLPALSPSIIRDTLLPAIGRAVARFGLRAALDASTRTERTHIDQAAHLAPNVAAVAELMAALPNLVEERGEWIKVGAAIRGAVGPEGDAGGEAAFVEWSSRYDGPQREDPATVYHTIHRPVAVGWSYLQELGRSVGIQSAIDEFGPIAGAVAPESRVALDTDAEQVAQLLGYAGRAMPLLLADTRLVGPEFRAVRASVAAAVLVPHPHGGFFRSDVLDAANASKAYASDIARFRLALNTHLVANRTWLSLDAEARRVLSLAAFCHVCDVRLIGGRQSDLGPFMVSGDGPTIAWLVPGLVERGVVGSLVGPSGVGKTTFALALASAGAADKRDEIGASMPRAFMGVSIPAFSTLVCAREDAPGALARVEAYAQHHATGSVEHVYIVSNVPALLDESTGTDAILACVHRIPADAPPLGLIIIDHFRDAIGGADGNDGAVAQAAFTTAESCARATGAAVMLIDHTGHNEDRAAASGSKVKYDKSAFVVKLDKRGDSETIAARWVKVKNAASNAVTLFHLAGNVAVEGPAAKPTSEAAPIADDAMLDAVMQRIATHHAVSRAEIMSALADAYVGRFTEAGAGVKRQTIAGRLSAAIDAALGKSWIAQKGAKYSIGAASPAKAERESAAREVAELVGEVAS